MASPGSGLFSKVLRADAAGSAFQKAYENTHIGLAGLVPIAALSGDGVLQRVADIGLGILIPVHSQIALNSVASDYIPKGSLGLSRYAILASSAVMFAGLLKLNLAGPGLTPTIRKLWQKEK
eukprot:jgi/Botrbrau1/12320/Bobra.0205s0018.1